VRERRTRDIIVREISEREGQNSERDISKREEDRERDRIVGEQNRR